MKLYLNLIVISSFVILFLSCDSGGNISDQSNSQDPVPSLSINNLSVTVAENPITDAVLGTFSTTQENLNNPVSFTLVEQSATEAIKINGSGELLVADAYAFDYETNTSIDGIVRISSGSLSDTAEFTIMITDVDEQSQQTFITKWNLLESDLSIKLPIYDGSGNDLTQYDFVVDWGDGIVREITSFNDPDATHTYTTPGEKEVKITGLLKGFNFGIVPQSRNWIVDVMQWGGIQLGNGGFHFRLCLNLLGFSATDIPDLTGLTNAEFMFESAPRFNADLSLWDTSNITNMNSMFRGALVFNSDLSNWNVSNVTDMTEMFAIARAFNQDLSAWDVSKVTSMLGMFSNTIAFNGNISTWDVGNVTDMSSMFLFSIAFNADLSSWDTSKVTTMENMFRSAFTFNSDISNWNVSNVTDMRSMFFNASAFNQDLSEWATDNVIACINFSSDSGLSPSNLPTKGCFVN